MIIDIDICVFARSDTSDLTFIGSRNADLTSSQRSVENRDDYGCLDSSRGVAKGALNGDSRQRKVISKTYLLTIYISYFALFQMDCV